VTTVPHPLATVPARSDRGRRRRRRLRLARAQLRFSVQNRLPSSVSAGRRTRLRVCAAADMLTALGIRVEVRRPPLPWPRARYVVVTGPLGTVGALAVTTVLRGEPIRPADEVPADATVCPLLVRYRPIGQTGYLAEHEVPRTAAEICALGGLVVEVHQLAPVPPAA
jgi:hypothetical protein